MSKRVIYILVIALLLMSMTACKKKDSPSSSLGNVKGTVLSQQTNAPIYGVTVEIASGSTVKKVETNLNGQYSAAVPAGDIIITASRAGYIAQKKTAALEKNAQLNVAPITLVLEDDAISIEGAATFDALLPNWSAKVYVEVSIIDNSQKYADMEEINGGTVKVSNYRIEGLKRDRNYIITARAANLPGDAKIDGPETQTNKNLIRKSELAAPELKTFIVNISPETTNFAAAVELYLANTGRGLNDAGVDEDLDAIMAADDPHQEAIDRSTTTVQGTIQDILSEPLGTATVVIIGSNPQISTVSNAGDGSFVIAEVPIRYQGVRAEKAPRYIAAEQKALVLVAGEPCDVTLKLDPNPAVIPDDLRDAAELMADNSSGTLTDWLTGGFEYTYMMDPPKDKATAMDALDVSYVAILPGPVTDYESVDSESRTDFNFDNENWTMRRETTYVRYSYTASGMVRYGNKRWQLVSLTVDQELRLPKAPTALTVTAGDATATVGWTAPMPNDPEIDGYQIYRTTTATPPADTALPINATVVVDKSYVDNPLPDGLSTGRYYYWVRSVDEYSVDEYSEVEILSEYSSAPSVYVVNALETVQQFITHALACDKDSMSGMLAADFTWKPVGALVTSTDKTRFVNYIYDQFSLGIAPGYPANQWVLQLSSPSFSRITAGSAATIAVPGSLVGWYSSTYAGRNRRWLEVLENWKVSLTSGKLQYFDAGARELYPGAPTEFACANISTMEVDEIVELEWQRPDDPLLAGYHVYRHVENDFSNAYPIEDADFVILTSTTGSVPYVAGEQIYYWLVAYDIYGEVSAPSNPVLTGVPNEIRVLAENFLQASYEEKETEVRKYITTDFFAYLLETQYSLTNYCSFDYFNMVAPPYEIASYRVVNPESSGVSGGSGADWNGIRASDDWMRYELTYIIKGGGTICTWHGIMCTNIVVQIANVNNEWRVFAATFLN